MALKLQSVYLYDAEYFDAFNLTDNPYLSFNLEEKNSLILLNNISLQIFLFYILKCEMLFLISYPVCLLYEH